MQSTRSCCRATEPCQPLILPNPGVQPSQQSQGQLRGGRSEIWTRHCVIATASIPAGTLAMAGAAGCGGTAAWVRELSHIPGFRQHRDKAVHSALFAQLLAEHWLCLLTAALCKSWLHSSRTPRAQPRMCPLCFLGIPPFLGTADFLPLWAVPHCTDDEFLSPALQVMQSPRWCSQHLCQ